MAGFSIHCGCGSTFTVNTVRADNPSPIKCPNCGAELSKDILIALKHFKDATDAIQNLNHKFSVVDPKFHVELIP